MRLPGRLLGVLAVAACAGCSSWQSALDPQGLQARTVAGVIVFFVAVCAVVWVVVMGVLLVALRRRRRPVPAGGDESLVDADRRLGRAVTRAAVATALIVAVLAAVSIVAARRITATDPDALVIRVRGYQFWWEITYLDPRPDQSFLTANEIHIPVGRQVRLELAAADVIHSFWVPNLSGKQDMIPGRSNTLTLTALQPGVYRGQCAEFCGMQHARMALLVIAEAPAEFEAWRAAQLAPAGPAGPASGPASAVAATAETDAGRQVFVAKACSSCHTVRGTDAAGTLGPDLTHVGSRRTIGAGLLENTRGSIAAWIADPQTLKPGNNMPMVDLTPDELKAVSAYMASLR